MTRTRLRRGLAALALIATLTLGSAACGKNSSTGMPGMDHGSAMPSSPSMGGMPGMDADEMPAGDGLAATMSGLTFAPATRSVPAGKPQPFAFQIRGGDGKPVMNFANDQTKLMHFYLIRSDLTGFQHLHPEMAADGTWTATPAALKPGTYRAYAAFIANDKSGKQTPLVLSDTVTVPGQAADAQLPPPATSTQVDGYTLTLGGDGLMANMSHIMTVTVSRDGNPVTDLQPYLATYAHLTAFHSGDLAFAHLHPHGTPGGDHGGPALTFTAMLPRPGNWRLFLQFQTAGVLHTAALTVNVG